MTELTEWIESMKEGVELVGLVLEVLPGRAGLQTSPAENEEGVCLEELVVLQVDSFGRVNLKENEENKMSDKIKGVTTKMKEIQNA